MKKTIALSALVLSILAGLVSGSLALYQKNVDIEGAGSVVAKKFALSAGKTDSYKTGVTIAPTEKVTAAFTVSNFEDDYVSEVGMDLNVTITLAAADGKTAIPYITARLLDENGNAIDAAVNGVTAGVGEITLSVDHAFTVSEDNGGKQTKTYQIELTWEDGHTDTDINYQGPNFGTQYTVSVTGIQDVAA